MKQMNPATEARTGKTRSEAVNLDTPSHGLRICATSTAASRSRHRTNPEVIPAYCCPSSFTSDGPEGAAVTVCVTVGTGDGDGLDVGAAVAVAVGSGDGEGEVRSSVTPVAELPLSIPNDVAE